MGNLNMRLAMAHDGLRDLSSSPVSPWDSTGCMVRHVLVEAGCRSGGLDMNLGLSFSPSLGTKLMRRLLRSSLVSGSTTCP